MDAISTATRGMQQALSRMDNHAQRLASMSADPTIDPTPEIIGTMQAKAVFMANLQIAKRADAALGSLLDTWA